MSARDNVSLIRRWGRDYYECSAGQRWQPIGCDRHSEHYWCTTCRGFYGVPHDDLHTGQYGGFAHDGVSYDRQCACRMCVNARSRYGDAK